jgi:hypothetical protein
MGAKNNQIRSPLFCLIKDDDRGSPTGVALQHTFKPAAVSVFRASAMASSARMARQ